MKTVKVFKAKILTASSVYRLTKKTDPLFESQISKLHLKNMVIVGDDHNAKTVLHELKANWPQQKKLFIGFITKGNLPGNKEYSSYESLEKILIDYYIDEILIPGEMEYNNYINPRISSKDLDLILNAAKKIGIKVSLVYIRESTPSMLPPFIKKSRIILNMHLLNFANRGQLELFIKRALDIILSLAALILLSPLFLLIYLLVRITSKGPAFYFQYRGGLRGKPFRMYKFRSMVLHADEMQARLMALNEMKGNGFKLSNDPRITKIGKFIRKTSIDELPQFLNILRGEMTIVGPRPIVISEIKKLQPYQHKRHAVKPGLTCIWQVSGRSQIDRYDDWMDLDVFYIDNYSLPFDLQLFVKTFPAILSGRGAK
ncbi:MAG: exopolysaccharide biosynthesis polyprenyl glycosylphosphotransferase [Oligoflexia bacterium]|nr:exopolysaccharide biosynthesis polyprenyl glycosylphosphotransferase [Oligoflexia bacterium]